MIDSRRLTVEATKDFVAIDFSEYFKFIREQENLRKVAKLLYIFLTTSDEGQKYKQINSADNCIHHYYVKILNFVDPELQLNQTNPVIKNKLK